MVPYILLLLIPALFAFIGIDRSQKPSRLLIGSANHPVIQANNPVVPIFFVLFFLMLALRHETIGRDLVSYKMFFEVYPRQSLEYFNLFRTESLYRLLNWFVGQFTDNFQVFVAVVAAITVVPVAMIYNRYRHHGYVQIVIFVCMSSFVICFSALRQVIAIALGAVAYRLVQKKQWVWFLLVTVIALGFHHSAFMILFMYPLYYIRLKRNHLWIVVPMLLLVLVFNSPIFQMLTTVMSFFGEEYDLVESVTGAYTMLILFFVFTVYSYVVADESQMDDELLGLRNFLLFAVVLQCFAPLHPLAMRINYYYVMFIPMTMARLIDVPKPNMKRVAKLASLLIALYFTYDFLSKTYQSYITGVSSLDTIPYKFFWMG